MLHVRNTPKRRRFLSLIAGAGIACLLLVACPSRNLYRIQVDVTPHGAGIVKLSRDAGVYQSGTVIAMTANAAEGYAFHYWEGNVANTSTASTKITLYRNELVVAHFVSADGTPPTEGEGSASEEGDPEGDATEDGESGADKEGSAADVEGAAGNGGGEGAAANEGEGERE